MTVNLPSELSSFQQKSSDTRLTIAFIESTAAMGGVQFSTLYLLQHLAPVMWDTVVVCPEEDDLSEACRRCGIGVHILNGPRFRSTSVRVGRNGARLPNPFAWAFDLWVLMLLAFKLGSFLRLKQPDLVVTKGLFAHFYGGLAAQVLNIRCIWHVQDFISERFLKIYQRFFSQSARWLPDHVIVDGASIARQIQGSVPDRISLIHNGVDTTIFRPEIDGRSIRQELQIPLEAIVIGHVGRMTQWKGQHFLLEAFARVAAEIPNAYLLFVGAPVFDRDTYQRQLVNLSYELGLSNRVKFSGYRRDLPVVLASMDVFVFSSIEKDTSPLALLSAMSSGLPIVAFDIDGVRELVPENEQLLVPVAQVDDLAVAIKKLLSNSLLRRELAVAARRRAEKEFDIAQHANSMEKVFLRASQNQRAYRMVSGIRDSITEG